MELRTSRPVMTCEGSDYPNHVNLRQTGGGFHGGFSSWCWEGSWPELVSKNPFRSRKIGEFTLRCPSLRIRRLLLNEL